MATPDLLNLKHMRALEVRDAGDHYVIRADGQGVPTQCPECQGSDMYGHGIQQQAYIDTPIHGKRVMLEIDRRRYRCKQCGKTLFASLPEIDSKRLATTRFVRYVEEQCLKKTFAELSREVGVDDKTIRHIFDDYIAGLQQTVRFETPEILGIDELKIVGQYRAMITNVQTLSMFDMLPSRSKADLLTYFRKMPDKHAVKVLTMDLWNVYRQVAETMFPGRMVVADRWHVVRMANDAMEKTRKAVRKTLDTRTRLKLKDDRFMLLQRDRTLDDEQRATIKEWSKQFPVLGVAYKVKEAFHDLYEYKSRREAEKAIEAWLNSVPTEVEAQFKDAATALRNWKNEVLNYYECKISNAYTESLNRLAKDLNRMGRGYSFEVIRARLLYEDKARAVTRKTLRSRGGPPHIDTQRDGLMGAPVDPVAIAAGGPAGRTLEYGPHIPTLCDLLESGHFD